MDYGDLVVLSGTNYFLLNDFALSLRENEYEFTSYEEYVEKKFGLDFHPGFADLLFYS